MLAIPSTRGCELHRRGCNVTTSPSAAGTSGNLGEDGNRRIRKLRATRSGLIVLPDIQLTGGAGSLQTESPREKWRLQAVKGLEHDTETEVPRRSQGAGSSLVSQTAESILKYGLWENAHDLVFTNLTGGPLDGTNVLRRCFRPLLKGGGLPEVRFHDLRHTAATLLRGQGVHSKIVSNRKWSVASTAVASLR